MTLTLKEPGSIDNFQQWISRLGVFDHENFFCKSVSNFVIGRCSSVWLTESEDS